MNKKILIAGSAVFVILLVSGGVWWLRNRSIQGLQPQKIEVGATSTSDLPVNTSLSEEPVMQQKEPQGIKNTDRTKAESSDYPLIDELANAQATTVEDGALQPTPPSPVASVDADSDGLTTEQEAALGTDPNNADTDGDGLTDLQEVTIYKTDPLKADTDGDTFPDGAEVKAGYNPLGPGKCARVSCIP